MFQILLLLGWMMQMCLVVVVWFVQNRKWLLFGLQFIVVYIGLLVSYCVSVVLVLKLIDVCCFVVSVMWLVIMFFCGLKFWLLFYCRQKSWFWCGLKVMGQCCELLLDLLISFVYLLFMGDYFFNYVLMILFVVWICVVLQWLMGMLVQVLVVFYLLVFRLNLLIVGKVQVVLKLLEELNSISWLICGIKCSEL